VTDEEVEIDVEIAAPHDLSLFTTFSLFCAMDVDDVFDIHVEGIVREDIVHVEGIVHGVVGEGVDLIVEDRVLELAFRHLPADEFALLEVVAVDDFCKTAGGTSGP
jgi:hypothetical protein